LLVASGVAFGVSQVGDDEHSFSTMRRANIGRANNCPLRVIPSSGQTSENGIDPPNKESSNVLHNDDVWSKLANTSVELKPEPRSGPFQ
jgi:hypothetical protein